MAAEVEKQEKVVNPVAAENDQASQRSKPGSNVDDGAEKEDKGSMKDFLVGVTNLDSTSYLHLQARLQVC